MKEILMCSADFLKHIKTAFQWGIFSQGNVMKVVTLKVLKKMGIPILKKFLLKKMGSLIQFLLVMCFKIYFYYLFLKKKNKLIDLFEIKIV